MNLPTLPAAGEHFPTLASDAAWCWFADPRAVYFEGRHRRTYVGWVDFAWGAIHLASYDHNSGQVLHHYLRDLERDDHANPALHMLPDGRLMVLYAPHHGGAMYYRVSEQPEDICTWGPERTIPVNTPGGHGFTYPNPAQLSAENHKLYLFWRGGNWSPTFATSEDNGQSWSEARNIFLVPGVRPYSKYAGNGIDTIHMAFTDAHPNQRPDNSIYYVKYRDGALWRADGTRIRALDEAPVTPADVDLIYDARARGARGWIWDVAGDAAGHPVLVYATIPDQLDHRYRYARWDGARWLDHEITAAGRNIDGDTEPEYSGGIYLDHEDVNVVYLSRQAGPGGPFEIERWETTDLGASWQSTPITRGSSGKNVRPFVPRGRRAGELELFWMNGVYDHWTEYATSIRMWPANKWTPPTRPFM